MSKAAPNIFINFFIVITFLYLEFYIKTKRE